MKSTFKPTFSVLPSAQRILWPGLKPLAERSFVLYGGTAIALRLGHRFSVDFDFFCDQSLDRAYLTQVLPFLSHATVLQDLPQTFTVLVPVDVGAQQEYVKISFFGEIAFGRIGLPQYTEDGVLCVASLEDLMATKLKVLLQRIEVKDYQDIAAMLRADVSLEKGLAAARLFYGPAFQPSASLKAMVYFQGGDMDNLTYADKEVLISYASAVKDLPRVDLAASMLS